MKGKIEVFNAIQNYGTAYRTLHEHAKNHPNDFPCGVISSGVIAEYYVKKYLETKHSGAIVTFGCANERAWDIEVVHDDSKTSARYQVKSASLFNKSRKISPLVKGFDKLIIVSLDLDFFPYQVYLFDDVAPIFGKDKVTAITVPDPDSPRKTGSRIFKHAINISSDFFDLLADVV